MNRIKSPAHIESYLSYEKLCDLDSIKPDPGFLIFFSSRSAMRDIGIGGVSVCHMSSYMQVQTPN